MILNIGLITEGNSNIGFGHITRCIAIFDYFKKLGLYVEFFINSNQSALKILDDRNCQLFNWLEDPNRLFDELQKKKFDFIFIDSYLTNIQFLEKLAQLDIKIIFIDDNYRIEYPRGYLLNWQIYASDLDFLQKKDRILLLGPKFCVLRQAFWNSKRNTIKEELNCILFILGGSDLRNLTPLFLKTICESYPDLKKDVIIGPGFTNKNEILENADSNTCFFESIDGDEMAELMGSADIVISGCGQTLYELACKGVPTIGVGIAENQRLNILHMGKLGFLKFAGWWNDKNIVDKLKNAMLQIQSYEIREKMSRIGYNLVSNNGIENIYNELKKKLNQ